MRQAKTPTLSPHPCQLGICPWRICPWQPFGLRRAAEQAPLWAPHPRRGPAGGPRLELGRWARGRRRRPERGRRRREGGDRRGKSFNTFIDALNATPHFRYAWPKYSPVPMPYGIGAVASCSRRLARSLSLLCIRAAPKCLPIHGSGTTLADPTTGRASTACGSSSVRAHLYGVY